MGFDKKKYNNKYEKEHYDRISVTLPKGGKQFLKEYAEGNNVSIAKLVSDAIEQYCNVDFSNDFNLKN